MTTYNFTIFKQCRSNVKALLDAYSLEQLNYIPKGYKNNLLWNAGHLVATQNLICYKAAGTSMLVPDSFVDTFRKGTLGRGYSKEEFDEVYSGIVEGADALEQRWEEESLDSYKEITTSFGITIRSAEEAINFNNTHEGVHIGYMLALRKHLI